MSTRQLTTVALTFAGALVAAAAYLTADDRPRIATGVQQPPAQVLVPLGYTTRLEFKIVHPEDTPMFFTHSTGGEFAINHDITEPNHEHSVQIEGVLSAGDDSGRLLLRYEIQTHHADLNEGIDVVHGASGSALLTPEESLTLTLLGDAALQVTATRAD